MRAPAPSGSDAAWRATLVGGVVVIVAVAGLLEALRRSVSAVDARVSDLWQAGQLLAANTQTAHLLDQTRSRSADILAALDRAPGDDER